MAKNASRFHQAAPLRQKGAPGEHVDVGVEHQHQHKNHAAGGADGDHAKVVAQPAAQGGLQRPGKVQNADHDKGQHIGRHCKGQHQGPVQPAPTWEVTQTGQPGQTDTQQHHPDDHTNGQHQRIAQQTGHLGFQQVIPDGAIQRVPAQRQDQQRQQHQYGAGVGNNAPLGLGNNRRKRHSDSTDQLQEQQRPAELGVQYIGKTAVNQCQPTRSISMMASA